MSLIPALAFIGIALARFLTFHQIRSLGPRSAAVLQAIGVDAATAGRRIISGDAKVSVVERHGGERQDDQCAKQAQAPL
jgi:hypothetical protein